MTTVIIIYTIASIAFIVFAHLVELNDYIVKEKIGVWGFTTITIAFMPVLLINYFWVWNWYECKTNEEIENNLKSTATDGQ